MLAWKRGDKQNLIFVFICITSHILTRSDRAPLDHRPQNIINPVQTPHHRTAAVRPSRGTSGKWSRQDFGRDVKKLETVHPDEQSDGVDSKDWCHHRGHDRSNFNHVSSKSFERFAGRCERVTNCCGPTLDTTSKMASFLSTLTRSCVRFGQTGSASREVEAGQTGSESRARKGRYHSPSPSQARLVSSRRAA